MKRVNAILSVINSRSDIYGNRYWAMSLRHISGKMLGAGTVCADNVPWFISEGLGWHVERHELPIREFNRVTKGWSHAGCGIGEIVKNLSGKILNEEAIRTGRIGGRK